MEAEGATLGLSRCRLGPILGLLGSAGSGIAYQQERQIVRPALSLQGFLP